MQAQAQRGRMSICLKRGEVMSDPTYVLGRPDDEHARLTEQAKYVGAFVRVAS
jgi:hypothetical protein